MSLIIDIFNLFFFQPTINLLVFILRVLEASNIPGALGWSIIALTIVIRLIVWPFSAAQLKSAKKLTELKPHLDELKKKHGSDKQAFAQAQMALYKEHGVNPAGGCLPTLIQFPVLIALANVINTLFADKGLETINGFLYTSAWHLKEVPDPNFLGISLALKPIDVFSSMPLIILIPLITAALQFVLSKMMIPTPVKPYPADTVKEKKEKDSAEDMTAMMQTQMMIMLPIMIGYFAFIFQYGLSLFWNVSTLVGIYQQYLTAGWGGMKDFYKTLKLPIKK